ncbi:MAG TPA: carboxypeptidase regulatory-like domain-containing protein, partial [Bryobacteraceae bacterium]|nr:carboxypeptidase regulatory-like domain-containing protein [Bryobacteraceae bacterium]
MRSRIKVLVWTCATIALLFAYLGSIHAQAVNGTVVGTITDPTAAVVPNARVTITNLDTNTVRTASTDANGYYTFPDMPPGRYSVKVAKEGFASAEQSGITLLVNSTARVNLQLQPGAVSQTIEVTGVPSLLQTDTAQTGATMSSLQATQLPLGNNRNVQNLVNLVPGATMAQFNHSRFFNPQNSLNNQINGQSSLGNNYQIEGVNDNERTGLLQVYVPPMESVQQMDVTTSNYDPEQGVAVGAVINLILKSGSNDFHGNLFEIWNGSKLNARNFFNYGPNGQPYVKPHFVSNYWGGALGGPIRKNKTFFFVDYLRSTDHEAQFQQLGVPTGALKNGNFSDPALTKIYDPATGDKADCLPGGNSKNCGKGRTQFAGNIIPASRIDPIAAKLVALVPLPNAKLTASGTQKYQNNFLERTGFTQDINTFDTKVDQYVGAKDHISGRLSYTNPLTDQLPAFGPLAGGPVGGGFQGTGSDATYSAGLNWDHVFSPTLISEARIGLNRYRNVSNNSDYGTNSSTAIGIPGVNVSPFTSGMTTLNSTGFSGPLVGYSASMPWVRAETDIDVVDNWTKTMGNHTFKFGGNFIRIRDDLLQEQTFSPRGAWNFATGQTALNGGPSTGFANNFASLLLGVPNQVGRDLPIYFPAYRAWQLFFYGGDKWQVTPKLTLDLGLRWEFYPRAMPQFRGGFSNYDGDRNTLVIAGVGGNPLNLGINQRYHDFAPRIGVAFRPTDKDVIRAGFGISYEPFADNTYAYNFPVKQNNAFNSISSFGPAVLPTGTAATFAQGFPAPIVATVPSNGLIPVNTPLLLSQSYITIPKNYLDPYIESWNVTYERSLPDKVVLNVAYVGNRGVHIPLDYNLNSTTDPAYIGKGSAGQPFFQRYGMTSGVDLRYWQVSSDYNSMQVSVKRTFTTGLNLTGSYTWGKALGFGGENGENAPGAAYYVDFIRNYARTDFDREHMFNVSVIYDLPFGKGKKYLQGGPLNYIFGGWQVTTVVTLMSGLPLNFSCSCSSSLNTAGNAQSPELVSPLQKLYGINTVPWFNTSAFADPTLLFGTPTFGNLGRYIWSGPGFFNLDASLFKDIHVTERFNLQFRTDWYSATNTPHFNNPDTNLGDSNFGL